MTLLKGGENFTQNKKKTKKWRKVKEKEKQKIISVLN